MIELNYTPDRNAQEAVEDIDTLLKKCWESYNSEFEQPKLEEGLQKIPKLLADLGYWEAKADEWQDEAKAHRDFIKDTKPTDLVKDGEEQYVNQATARVLKSDEYKEANKEYLKAKRIYKIIRSKAKATERSFDGIRSRYSNVKRDIRETT